MRSILIIRIKDKLGTVQTKRGDIVDIRAEVPAIILDKVHIQLTELANPDWIVLSADGLPSDYYNLMKPNRGARGGVTRARMMRLDLDALQADYSLVHGVVNIVGLLQAYVKTKPTQDLQVL